MAAELDGAVNAATLARGKNLVTCPACVKVASSKYSALWSDCVVSLLSRDGSTLSTDEKVKTGSNAPHWLPPVSLYDNVRLNRSTRTTPASGLATKSRVRRKESSVIRGQHYKHYLSLRPGAAAGPALYGPTAGTHGHARTVPLPGTSGTAPGAMFLRPLQL